MELDAEPAQKPLAKIRQAKRFLRAGEEIVAAAKAAQEEFWSDLLDGTFDRGLALQVQARHLPAQGLEGPADAPCAGEKLEPHLMM